ncbi:hypothetical protein EV195_103189 [Tenacibaculum skagerrakense]|uniref:Zinc ribbon protein n=1 Tax=Tenacibaculum skagerrakense TaxID=186571 RepID=A0A4R2NV63_9FLAO|nr:zinc ribbon domain-containing protein [Tenacibaculum skagerrakense]TCP25827.1 hypothetical protein EV195_103189 [Tenacibaculum skagerrakense]
MENELLSNANNCSFCKNSIDKDVVFCPECGHPENGTDKQRAQFFAKRAMKKNKKIDDENKISSARNILFILSGIMAVLGFIIYSNTDNIIDLAINFFVAFIYLTLAFWSEQKPFIALLIGLILYITIIIVGFLIDPLSIVKGILWKIVIISLLAKGMHSALELKNKENNRF